MEDLYCTVCHCPASECRDETGGHRDWWLTPEQMAREDAIEAGEARYDDRK